VVDVVVAVVDVVSPLPGVVVVAVVVAVTPGPIIKGLSSLQNEVN